MFGVPPPHTHMLYPAVHWFPQEEISDRNGGLGNFGKEREFLCIPVGGTELHKKTKSWSVWSCQCAVDEWSDLCGKRKESPRVMGYFLLIIRLVSGTYSQEDGKSSLAIRNLRK